MLRGHLGGVDRLASACAPELEHAAHRAHMGSSGADEAVRPRLLPPERPARRSSESTGCSDRTPARWWSEWWSEWWSTRPREHSRGRPGSPRTASDLLLL